MWWQRYLTPEAGARVWTCGRSIPLEVLISTNRRTGALKNSLSNLLVFASNQRCVYYVEDSNSHSHMLTSLISWTTVSDVFTQLWSQVSCMENVFESLFVRILNLRKVWVHFLWTSSSYFAAYLHFSSVGLDIFWKTLRLGFCPHLDSWFQWCVALDRVGLLGHPW